MPGAAMTLDWSQRPLIIGEVGQAHDGSLGTAHAFIDAIADAGADAVKFQTHIAAAESHPSEPWRVKFSPQDASRYAYWERMEFSEEQWTGLRRHATPLGPADDGDDRLQLRTTEPGRLADQLAALGADVLVESPPEVRDAVVARLTRLAGMGVTA